MTKAKLTSRPTAEQDIAFIALNLWDRGDVEIRNYGLHSREHLKDHLFGMFSHSRYHSECLLDGEEPVAVFGAYQIGDNDFSTWFIATERFQEFGLQITRYLTRFIKAEINTRPPGVYLELVSSSEHPHAPEWFKAIGFEKKKEQGTAFTTYVYKGRIKRG